MAGFNDDSFNLLADARNEKAQADAEAAAAAAALTDEEIKSQAQEDAQELIAEHFSESDEQVSQIAAATAANSEQIRDCAIAANAELVNLKNTYDNVVLLLTRPVNSQGENVGNAPQEGFGLDKGKYDNWLESLRSHVDPSQGGKLFDVGNARSPVGTSIRNNRMFDSSNLTTLGHALYDAFQYGPLAPWQTLPNWDTEFGIPTRRRSAMINAQIDVDTTGTESSRANSLGAEFLAGSAVADVGVSGKFFKTAYPEGTGLLSGSQWQNYVALQSQYQAGGEITDAVDLSYCPVADYPTGWQTALMMLLKIVATMVGESTETSTTPQGTNVVYGSNEIIDPDNSAEAILKAEAGLQRIYFPKYLRHFLPSTPYTSNDTPTIKKERLIQSSNHGSYLGFRSNDMDTGGDTIGDGQYISNARKLCERIGEAAVKLSALSEYQAESSAVNEAMIQTQNYDVMISPNVKAGLQRSAAILTWIAATFADYFGDVHQESGIGAHYVCILEAADRQSALNDQLEELIAEAIENEREVPDWYENADEAQKRLYDDSVANAIAARRRQVELGRSETEAAEEALELASVRDHLFNEQCFLLRFIDLFAEHKIDWLDPYITDTAKANKRLPYVMSSRNDTPVKGNATLLVNGDPYGFINKLTLSPKLEALMNIANHELSSIQPRIRLFKVVYPQVADVDNNDDAYEVEMDFDSNTTSEDLELFLANGGLRGVGSGIKSFNFSYEGSNPFAVKKSIKANLKIFANSMDELFRIRRGKNSQGKMVDYKYVDLVLKTGGNKLIKADNTKCSNGATDTQRQNIELADLNFRLKAQVGLASPGTGGDLSAVSSAVRTALQESFVTLNLTPTVHNFEIDDLGRVILNINYLAYIEEFFDSAHFNIFADAHINNDTGAQNLVALRRLQRTMALEHVAKKCDSTAKSQLKEEYKKEVNREVRASISYLIESMIEQRKIRYLEIPTDKVMNIDRLDPDETLKLYEDIHRAIVDRANMDDDAITAAMAQDTDAQVQNDLIEKLGNTLAQYAAEPAEGEEEEQNDDAIALALMSGDYVNTTLTYFYVSDLVDMILHNIDKELAAMVQGSSIKIGLSSLRTPNNQAITVSDEVIEAKRRELEATKRAFEKLRILLGPVEISPQGAGDAKTHNLQITLGDIPVSVKYFIGFLTDKMLKKDESLYPLTKFLNDLFNILVKDFLNGTDCSAANSQKIRVQQAALTSYAPIKETINSEGTYDIVTLAQSGISMGREANELVNFRTSINNLTANQEIGEPASILNISGPEGSVKTTVPLDNEFNFFVYSAGQVQPMEKMNGKKAEDERRGIFHYLLGRDRGLIKNIKLSKTQTKGLAEVRFEQDGYDGLQQMRVIYDVQIDSYANVNTFPGTYLYVDPKGFLPHSANAPDLTKIGIGGYYMIIRAEHEFGPGTANTTIHAKWVNSIENDAIQAECRELETEAHGSGDRANPSCRFVDPPKEPEPPEDNGIPWIPFI
jgi:hypothetical protein